MAINRTWKFAGASLALSVMIAAVLANGQWARFPLAVAIGLMYSLAIGLPCALVFRRIGPRVAGRPDLQQWLVYAGVVVVITVAGTLVVRFVLVLIGLIDLDAMWDGMLVSFEISILIAVPCTIGAVTFSKLHKQIARTEHEKQRALMLAAEARLASLESRIRPHFLFNALNSALALIPEDPASAEQVLVRLCTLLRFSLDAQPNRLIALGEELRVVIDYLEIERVRFGDRLSYEIDVPDELRAVEIPAFAVQTLVENSVKYAVSPRKQGAHIVVRARRTDERLVLEIADDGPGFSGPVWVAGHGLDGLRARLDALYGSAAQLVAPALAASGAAVTIELPA